MRSWAGRTAVFTRTSDGVQMCGTFEPPGELDDVARAIAVVNGSWARGVVRFASYGESSALVSVALSVDDGAPVEWHLIAVDAPDCATIRRPLDYALNPFDVDVRAADDECSSERAHLCAVGDLTAKLGRLRGTSKATFVVDLLPVGGPFDGTHATS